MFLILSMSSADIQSVAMPPPPAPDLLGGAFSSLRTNVFDKLTRAAPPSVDTNAASTSTKPETPAIAMLLTSMLDRSNSRADQITPISASTGSQAISPKTPNKPVTIKISCAVCSYTPRRHIGAPGHQGGCTGAGVRVVVSRAKKRRTKAERN